MEIISTTQLRTQSSNLIHALQNGKTISLIHRSKKVGLIMPALNVTDVAIKTVNVRRLETTLQNISPKTKLSDSQRNENYRAHFEQKYAQ